MFNVYSIENQNFYLNNSIISGIQGLSISYNNNIEPSLRVNDSNRNYFISKPVIGNFNLDYILSSSDRFISFTGSQPFSGRIEYGNNFFTFSSGYVTNYSVNYRLGEYPTVNTRALILGELGNTSGIFSYNPSVLNSFLSADNYYIDLNLNEANFNRLESFSLNIEIPREPIYTIGNYLPNEVIIKYPISINLNFELSMSRYNQENITNLFTGINQRNIILSFKEYNSNRNILGLNLPDCIDAETNLRYSINDDAKLTINLNTFILSGV
jgi:hypothetical protein